MAPALTDKLRESLDVFQSHNAETIARLRASQEKLALAVRQIQQSWSGSFAGWHGRMYFGEFEKPSVQEMFSPEWGGIHGIPHGWQERSTEEVAAHVNQLVGAGFSIETYEKDVRAIRVEFNDLHEELKIDLARHGALAGGKAREFVDAINAFDTGTTIEEHVSSHLPKGMMSRDSSALSQGMVLPAWLFYEGVAVEAKGQLTSIVSLLKLIGRLDRSLADFAEGGDTLAQTALLSSGTLHPEIAEKCSPLYKPGTYAESVEKGFKVVRDRLRKLTGHETGSEAFGKGKLHIIGAAAPHVDNDFNQAVKFLTMAIDMFRNEKSHTSDAHIADPVRAHHYLVLSSLAMYLLDNAEVAK